MAGNTLTIGARFKPMSYAEMIAPLQGANIEYKTQQEELDKLTQASSVWENMANKETDPLAHKKYTDYAAELKQQADALASQGLTPNTRKAISRMKGKYQSDIVPIEQAYKTRAELAKSYEAARRQNPTLMSNIDPSKLSLDQLIANPSLTPEYYSGSLLAEQVANKAKSVASEMLSTGKWTSTAGGQRLERIVKNGFSAQDVALAQSGKGPQELRDLVNNVIKSSPIGKWDNKAELLPRAYQYAASGLYAGIGKRDIEGMSDQSYLTPIQKWQMKKDAEAEAAKAEAAKREKETNSIDVDQEDIITPILYNKLNEKYLVNNKLSGAGLALIKKYTSGQLKENNQNISGYGSNMEDVNFVERKWAEDLIKGLGIWEDVKAGKSITVADINKRITQIQNNERYDGSLTRTNRVPLQPLASETLARKIMSLPEDTELIEVDNVDEKGKYVGSNSVKSKNLFKSEQDFKNILKVNYNKANMTMTFNKDGKNYILPNSVLSPAEFEKMRQNSINSSSTEAIDAQIDEAIKENGQNPKTLTESRRNFLRIQYQNAVVESNQQSAASLTGSYPRVNW